MTTPETVPLPQWEKERETIFALVLDLNKKVSVFDELEAQQLQVDLYKAVGFSLRQIRRSAVRRAKELERKRPKNDRKA